MDDRVAAGAAVAVGLDFVDRKNEAIFARVVGSAFLFMLFQKVGGPGQVLLLFFAALGLHLAELFL